ncbi:UNVERIFIED_CONTAM: hypothetical protein Sradi_2667900 [Sesamum radiatum]|uniref:Transposase-associated domain-containing protein n=1 Tax=Sesamum radiatum TaxID=300843 RepID=A0AAW2S5S6_SESRA
MYNKNILWRAGLTPEFEDGVKTFIEWAKGQRGYMDGDKISCPCRKCKNKASYHLSMRGFMSEYYNWTSHGEKCVQDYFEAATVPPVSEERTPAGHAEGILGLPIVCKNGCMLYWRDDINLEYCKFCGDARYKPSGGRDSHRKKSPYDVLR